MNCHSIGKLVAPNIDKLLCYFDKGHMNPSAPSPAIIEAMAPLFAALSSLAPLKENEEVKSIWLRIPRGEINDFDSYDELVDQEIVSNYEEYENYWLTEYPEKIKWYKLVIVESSNKKGKFVFVRYALITR